MAANPERRAQLADAGLRVLGADGARKLTHRAVDREAGVPLGTCANYFPTRDDLLGALGARIFERLAPEPDRLEALAGRTPDVDLYVDYMRYLVERTTAQPDLTVALMELRLESRRSPGLAEVLGATLSRNYRLDVEFNDAAGLPATALDVALLHFAIDGLLLDLLTPSIGADATPDELVTALVTRLLARPGTGPLSSPPGPPAE
ncbi:TetR/AcrR family transcriptional regulator [Rhodococcus sp. GXMU-t2271]|uniref:TetR/AcrR family transcriptional regulator n=1 Tax=Rhodococcus sp. GXMU-t2271 TaxID=3059079 RepID=UPI00352A893B